MGSANPEVLVPSNPCEMPVVSSTDYFEVEQILMSILLWDTQRKRRRGEVPRREKSILRRIVDESGQVRTIKLKILAAGNNGFPTATDLSFHMAFQRLLYERRTRDEKIENPICVTGAEMIRLRGVARAGSSYEDFWHYCESMSLTGLLLDRSQSVRSKGERKEQQITWKVFDQVVREGTRRLDGTVTDRYEIYLSRWFLDSLQAGHCLLVDYSLFSKLVRPLSQILHQALHSLFSMRGGHADIQYSELVENVQAGRFTALSRIRQQMDPCHEELLKLGLLESWRYDPLPDRKDYMIRYVAGPQWWESSRKMREALENRPQPRAGLVPQYDPFALDVSTASPDRSEEPAQVQMMIEDIYEFIGRRDAKYYPFWLQAVKSLDRTAIYVAMGAVRELGELGRLRKSRASCLVWKLQQIAARRGLSWGLRGKPAVPGVAMEQQPSLL